MDRSSTHVRWFTTLWVMAFSEHYFDGEMTRTLPLVLAVVVPVMLSPDSVPAFVVFLVLTTVATVLGLPVVANHLVLSLVVNLALGAAGLVALLEHRRASSAATTAFSARWLEVARAPASLILLVVYFFAFFHKLNASFFDPAVSCAGDLAQRGLILLGVHRELPPLVILGTACLVIAWEASILVALAVPRWRGWGLLAGFVFHVGLGVSGFYDFATYAFALYVLLVGHELASVRRPDHWRRVAVSAWGAQACVTLLSRVVPALGLPVWSGWELLKILTWLCAVGALLIPMIQATLPQARVLRPSVWNVRPAWLLVFPALAFLNGASPYLGLKSVANFSMFSNLRTEEGAGNHFLPALGRLEMTTWQRDTVDVLEVDFPEPIRANWLTNLKGAAHWADQESRWLVRNEPVRVRIPWLELRRTVLAWKAAGVEGVSVKYQRDGAERSVADAVQDPELSAPLPAWSRWLIAFREIDPKAGPTRCRW